MIIVGVDTALRTTGYGVIESSGKQVRAVDCGIIANPSGVALSECLRRLYGGMSQLLTSYRPDVAAIEGGFFHRNARTAMVLGMARGAVVACFANAAVPVYEYAPRKARKVVLGHGAADKAEVAAFLAPMLGLDVSQIPDDATDALAIAACHALNVQQANGIYLPDPI